MAALVNLNLNFDGDLICRVGTKLIEGCRTIKNVAQRYRRDSNVKAILRALASTEDGSIITLKSIEIEGVPCPLLRAAAVRSELTDTLIESCLDSTAAWKIRDEQFCFKSKFASGSLIDAVERLRSGLAYSDIGLLSSRICSAEFDEICDTTNMLAMAKRRFQSEPDLFVGDMSLIKAIEANTHGLGDENVGVLCEGTPIFVGDVFGSPGIVRWHPQSGAVFSYKDRRTKLNWRADSSWKKVIAKLAETNTDVEVTRAVFNRLETTMPQVISTTEEIDLLYLIKEVLEHRDIYAEDHDAISDAIFDQLTLRSRFMMKARELTGARWMSLDMADRRDEQKIGTLSAQAEEKVKARPDKVVELIRETLQDTGSMSGLRWDMSMFNSSGARNAIEILKMHSRYLEKCKPNADMREKHRGMHLSVLAARRMYHSEFGQKKGDVHLTYGLEKIVSERYPTKTEFRDMSVIYSPGSESVYVYILGEEVLSEITDTKRQPLAGTNPSMLACARLLLSMATQRSDSKQLVLEVERFLAGSLSAIFKLHDFLVRKMFGQAGEVVNLSDIHEEAVRLFGDRNKANWATVEVLSMLSSMGVVDSAQTVGKSCLYDRLGSIHGGIVAGVAKINLNTYPDLSYVEVLQADGKTYVALDTDNRRALIISGMDPSLTRDQAERKIYHVTLGSRPNEDDGVTRLRFLSLKVGKAAIMYP